MVASLFKARFRVKVIFPSLFSEFDYSAASRMGVDIARILQEGKNLPRSDLDAVMWYLTTMGGPAAFQEHRAHAERFLHFLFRIKSKSLVDLVERDIDEYFKFVDDPQPKADWVSNVPQTVKRSDPKWRPFMRPLSPRTRKNLRLAITRLILWLQKIHYVNFFHLGQYSAGTGENFPKYFTKKQWELLKSFVETLHTGVLSQDAKYHRVRWIIQLAYLGGLDASEIIKTPMRNFTNAAKFNGIQRMELHAVSDESVEMRKIFVGPDLLQELGVYRKSLGLSLVPAKGESGFLVLPYRVKSTGLYFKKVIESDVSNLLKWVFRGFARYLLSEHPDSVADAESIEKANITWIRLTGARSLLDNGIAIPMVCKFLGVAKTSKLLRQLRHDTVEPFEQVAMNHSSTWPSQRL